MNHETPPFDLYGFQHKAMPVLLGWSALSILSGAALVLGGDKRSKGIGSQFIGWGLIDGLIAWFGWRGAQQKQLARLNGEVSDADQAKEAATFETLLWVNAGLDVGYILGGAWLIRKSRGGNGNPEDAFKHGMGVGVQIQGAFLLVWDLTLGWLVRRGRM